MRLTANVFTLILLALALAACSSSPSQDTASVTASEYGAGTETTSQASIAVPFDPIKCVRYTPSGTRISQKVCKKQSEWDRIQRESQEQLQNVQRTSVHENQTL